MRTWVKRLQKSWVWQVIVMVILLPVLRKALDFALRLLVHGQDALRCGGNLMRRSTFCWILVILLGLVFALLQTAGCVAPPATPVLNAPYPRLAFYKDYPLIPENVARLAQRNLLISFAHEQTTNQLELRAFRKLNPSIVLLVYIQANEIATEDYVDYGWNHLKHLLYQGIDDAWWLVEEGSTLTEGIDSTQTHIPVAAGTAFTLTSFSGDPTYVLVEHEHMKIVGISGNILFVERGFNSIACPHPAGTHVAPHLSGWPGSWQLNLSNLCPPDATGQRWNTYLADHVHTQLMSSGLWDGIFYDNLVTDISHVSHAIDVDRDGQADDPGWVDFQHRQGINTLLARTRANEGWGVPVVGNSTPSAYWRQYLNGIFHEGFDDWSRWSDVMPVYRTMTSQYVTPPMSVIYANSPHGDDYQKVRFDLAAALMGDGYFVFDSGEYFAPHPLWWYDEYDNAGRGKGYLGQPLGPAYRLIDSLSTANLTAGGRFENQQDFENGPLYAHAPAGYTATLTLDSDAAEGNYSAKITNMGPYGATWYIKLDSPPFVAASNTDYTLSFWAKATEPFEVLLWVEGPDIGGVHHNHLSPRLVISTTWQLHQLSFPVEQGSTEERVYFVLGELPGAIWLDDVRIQEGSVELWRRDFEGGTVLWNATPLTQTVDLGQTFYKIRGSQDPLVNDGSAVQVVGLPPRDGLILLR